MNHDKTQLVLAQLAILIFAFIVFFSHSALIPWIIIVLGLALAFSIGTVLAIVSHIRKTESSDVKQQYSAVLGTHIGGMICYTVAISFIFPRLN